MQKTAGSHFSKRIGDAELSTVTYPSLFHACLLERRSSRGLFFFSPGAAVVRHNYVAVHAAM